ncbi:hypothetical protein CXG81DRAFT_26053 [Caulochytrium protostelioides]|uniref:Uncharacterized protein n=1 Tax=Caulochytrium protostelioides TaxID=1555241 RepID=A0A4P9WZ13_9FUNG|nr:hypothetical protein CAUPRSCDRAFT_10784 [Caulochytrium protostelioides]RKP01246.1 hypothetical protein CXG81DRAFT_26053 [Caulochytrium protostelioides]|eukprot:RKP01246.1 hypothetical protein CXG81DRAFT_26053 [Caulochytrium protostelioides]
MFAPSTARVLGIASSAMRRPVALMPSSAPASMLSGRRLISSKNNSQDELSDAQASSGTLSKMYHHSKAHGSIGPLVGITAMVMGFMAWWLVDHLGDHNPAAPGFREAQTTPLKNQHKFNPYRTPETMRQGYEQAIKQDETPRFLELFHTKRPDNAPATDAAARATL